MKTILKKMSMLILSFISVLFIFLPISNNLLTAYAAPLLGDESTILSDKEIQPDIKLNVKSKNIVKGKSFQIKVYNTLEDQSISYKSNDESVATVSSEGMITGIEFGSAVITVTIKQEAKTIATLQCNVSIGVPAICVRFTKSDLLMVVGQKTTLKYLIAPFNTAEDVRFLSLNPTVADISVGGRISAASVGTTYCFALIDSGYSSCKVSVISQEMYEQLKALGYEDLTTLPKDLLEAVISVPANEDQVVPDIVSNSIEKKAITDNSKESELLPFELPLLPFTEFNIAK